MILLCMLLLHLQICATDRVSLEMTKKPNIIFVLADDVGFSDFGYNNANSPIPTPFIDKLATGPGGVVLRQHYSQSLCTPTRAALLTGRYAINTGLTFVLMPGSPAGLPEHIETLPQALKRTANYSTAMSGKWHLGHAQHKMTPIGRGFDRFTGIYTWDADSFTKQMYLQPWQPHMIDWVEEFSNGTFVHFAEPRHSTIAITENAIEMMRQHASSSEAETSPLFLYVPYTAAHSPLQPLPEHLARCQHIPHLWRREYCGMVVGIDEGIKNLTRAAREYFADNVVLVVVSDNGGSPWFGGLNYPLRGSKNTPYEGGVHVPAFLVDFSVDGRYFGASHDSTRGRVYSGMVHISDWLPTLLHAAGVPEESFPKGLDGMQLRSVLRESPEYEIKTQHRSEVLLELLCAEETVFEADLMAYRRNNWKLVIGFSRDSEWYFESHEDKLNSTDATLYTAVGEKILRGMEHWVKPGPFDTTRIVITHNILHRLMQKHRAKASCVKYGSDGPRLGSTGRVLTSSNNAVDECSHIQLFDLSMDPSETVNLAVQRPDVVEELYEKIMRYKKNRPPQPKLVMQFHPTKVWPKSFVAGNCSVNPAIHESIKHHHVGTPHYNHICRFTHPWVDDSVTDVYALPGLISSLEYTVTVMKEDALILLLILSGLIVSVCVPYYFSGRVFRNRQASH